MQHTIKIEKMTQNGRALTENVFLMVRCIGSASKDVVQTIDYVENQDKLKTFMHFLLTVEEGLILIFVAMKHECCTERVYHEL
jgi:ATP-dependent RNA helicase DDX3X